MGSDDRMPIMDSYVFKGVDTLLVSEIFGEGASDVLGVNHIDTGPAMLGEVQKIFADASAHLPVGWVSIKPQLQFRQEKGFKALEQSNVMELTFVISARREVVAGKTIKVADIRMAVDKRSSHQNGGIETSYPFIVPDTKEALQERMLDGVFYLASTLPHYFVCGNRHGPKTAQCPDCSLSACSFYETWEERR
jgi:hypothetical protein